MRYLLKKRDVQAHMKERKKDYANKVTPVCVN